MNDERTGSISKQVNLEGPQPGRFIHVTETIRWVRLPLALPLGHINVWLIDDGDSWTLVDTGINHPICLEAWLRLLPELEQQKPLRQVLITHHHPDHIGLAGWLRARTGCSVRMTRMAFATARNARSPAGSSVRESLADFARLHGVDDSLDLMTGFWCGEFYERIVTEVPEVDSYIEDGETLMIGGVQWQSILMQGHAHDHVVLASSDRQLLISGDQILPHISPNISVYPSESLANPLEEYLASLDQLKTLGEPLICPSHGNVFRGLAQRCDQLREHHQEILRRTLSICDKPSTVRSVLEQLYPRAVGTFNMALAFGEALAHLRYLESIKLVYRVTVGGNCLFQAAART